MKKTLLWILTLSLLLCCLSGCKSDDPTASQPPSESTEASPLDVRYQVAMVSDYGDVTEEDYNRVTYESGRDWCEEYGIPYAYYKPTEDSLEARIVAIEQAIREGANILLLPGYIFGSAIAETAEQHPEVYYIALDVTAADIGEGYRCTKNVLAVSYKEEIAGFLAGYATVKMGCSDLAFVGSMSVPAVMRYGYGFIQGADYAAGQTETEVSIKHGYGQYCFCDAGIHATQNHVDQWFTEGMDAVFFCGGPLYTCMEQRDRAYDLKIIVDDVDRKNTIDDMYGEGTALTSATKNLSATVSWVLSKLILEGDWDSLGGTFPALGLVSGTELEKNHVGLGVSTQWNDSFTKEDYAAIVDALITGAVTVDNSIEQVPFTKHTTVEYLGNFK